MSMATNTASNRCKIVKWLQSQLTVASLALLIVLTLCSAAVHARNIGPDTFGYTARDNETFNFEDISVTGALSLEQADDEPFSLMLPFIFNFYGTDYAEINWNVNGLFTFLETTDEWVNEDMMIIDVPGGIDRPTIAPLWDDWKSDSQGAGVFYEMRGTPGARRFIVQWDTLNHFISPTVSSGTAQFQAVLYETSNDIVFQYADVLAGDTGDNGAEATVGIRDTDGHRNGEALQWSFDSGIISDSLAIRFGSPQPSAAATWTIRGNGDWDTATNWSSNPVFPGALDNVIIGPMSPDSPTIIGPAASTTVGSLTVGSRTGSATLNVQAGGDLTTQASLTVGANGTLTTPAAGSIFVGPSGSALINTPALLISNGGSVQGSSLEIGSVASDDILTLTGSGSTLAITRATTVNTGGTLTIDSGALYQTGTLSRNGTLNFRVGTLELAGSDLTIDDTAGGVLNNGDGQGQAADATPLELTSGRNLFVSGTTTIDASKPLQVSGGHFKSGLVALSGGQAELDFKSGTFELTNSDLNIGPGGQFELLSADAGDQLIIAQSTTVNSAGTLNIDGGSFTTGDVLELQANGSATISSGGTLNVSQLTVAHSTDFNFTNGNLNITGAGGLTVGVGGPLGSTMTLNRKTNLNVTNTMTIDNGAILELSDSTLTAGTLANSGVLRLGLQGQIDGNLTNNADGEVRIQSGEGLLFNGTAHSNAGKIEVVGNGDVLGGGAEIEFNGAVTNITSIGLITGRDATMRFNDGLTNDGSIGLSFGTSDVSGDINNTNTGNITVAGGGQVTFFGDITQNGTMVVASVGSTNSVAVVFGAFTGSGGFSGGGNVFALGDLRPGSSPDMVNYGGNLFLGPQTFVAVELGGLSAGADYDQMIVSGSVGLAGQLEIQLINGFQPDYGDSFTIMTFASSNDRFHTINGTSVNSNMTLAYLPTATQLTLTAALPGDANLNGIVNFEDFVQLSNNFNANETLWQDGNFNQDGITNFEDFVLLANNFGSMVPNGLAVVVPEPASWLIVALGAAVLGRLTCRHR